MAWYTTAIDKHECRIPGCRSRSAAVWVINPRNERTSTYCEPHGDAAVKRLNERDAVKRLNERDGLD